MTPARGKLGVMCVGLGAVTTTFITGCLLHCKGLGLLGGSVTQMARIRVGRGAEKQYKKVGEIVALTAVEDMVFGAWDLIPDNAFEAAVKADVLKAKDLFPVQEELSAIRPIAAAFDPNFVGRLEGQGDHVKSGSRADWAEALRTDIRRFKAEQGCERIVVLWAASTERFIDYDEATHGSLAALEAAIAANDTDHLPPSMIYAYAALKEGAPFIMGAPNLCLDIPAMWELAAQERVPIAGKDFKTGQTLMKTTLAPMLRTRALGLQGWFSTNILGNRDGEVLDAPENFKTKEVSKLGVIDSILDANAHPDLYGDIYHKVRINYYPPRGDNKEGWDNLDIFGWLGKDYGMQIKVDFLCRDSILAAPLCLDLVLCADLALRHGKAGNQEWLSFFLKSPMFDPAKADAPVHDLFQQYILFKNEVRRLGGYEADEELD